VLVAWPDGVQDGGLHGAHALQLRPYSYDQPGAGTLGLARNKQGSSPARCSRPRPHRTHTRAALLVPASPDSLQVRAAGPPRQAFSLQGPSLRSPHCFAGLQDFIRLELLSYCSAFCQPEPRTAAVHTHHRCCCFASGSRTSPHACMRAPGLRSPTPPGTATP
jgi:hypothetical protein